jgi:hypothetical protein
MRRDAKGALPEEHDWIEVERIQRRARFPGEADSIVVLLRGERTHLRKTVVVADNLGADDETKAILDCIAHKRFLGDW